MSPSESSFVSKNVELDKNVYIGPFCNLKKNVKIGKGSKLFGYINAYGCTIGDNCKIGTFVEIQENVKIKDNCKIQSHTFICEGVQIEEGVFIGHNVIFINDKVPRAINKEGKLKDVGEWKLLKTKIGKGASIGSGSVILPVKIGKWSMVGAGSVVTTDVPPFGLVYGVPAKLIKFVCKCGEVLDIKKHRKLNQKKTILTCKCGEKVIVNKENFDKLLKNKEDERAIP